MPAAWGAGGLGVTRAGVWPGWRGGAAAQRQIQGGTALSGFWKSPSDFSYSRGKPLPSQDGSEFGVLTHHDQRQWDWGEGQATVSDSRGDVSLPLRLLLQDFPCRVGSRDLASVTEVASPPGPAHTSPAQHVLAQPAAKGSCQAGCG